MYNVRLVNKKCHSLCVDLLKDVLEAAIVLLQDGVLCAGRKSNMKYHGYHALYTHIHVHHIPHIKGPSLLKSKLEGAVSKVSDTLSCVKRYMWTLNVCTLDQITEIFCHISPKTV